MSSEFQSILMFAAILPGKKLRYVLAEDDEDDVMFFRDAISELKLNVELEVAKDGSQLMEILHYQPFPDVIFLDLNMPLRNGLECLEEIRHSEMLKKNPVVIYSTSTERKDIVDTHS